MSRALPWLALLLVGCADNAILELTVNAPAPADAPAGATVAVLDFRSDPSIAPPSSEILGTDVLTEDVEIGESKSFSVVASGDDITTPLWIGVTYCPEVTGCLASGTTRSAWIRYERAFYRGRYTRHEIDLPTDGEADVGRCDVWGCDLEVRPPEAEGACFGERHVCE